MANGFTIPPDYVLNLGKYPNDGTGDSLYEAFTKIKNTFDNVYLNLGVVDSASVGTGESIVATPNKVDNILKFKSIEGTGGVTVTSTDTTISITAGSIVETDSAPNLGGNLFLNGHNIIGAGSPGVSGPNNDIKSTVWGLDIRELYNQIHALSVNLGNLDLGDNWSSPYGNYDLGGFTPL